MAKELQSRISALAATFVESVLSAVKSSSLEELVGGARSPTSPLATRPGRGAASSGSTSASTRPAAGPVHAAPGGRLPRRSAEDIAKVLEIVVSLLGSRKNGLRAEQIRTELNLQAKELPRILKEGLSRKKIRAVGHKRATTYFAK
jgi:hypothetical protein